MKNLLTSDWKKVALANYIVQPEILEKYLPKYTKMDFFNGNCYVSLVGFQVQNLKIADVKVPLISDFEQIDLRLYVKRFDGANWRRGIVIISSILDKPGLNSLTNSFFSTNYNSLPTSQEIKQTINELDVKYSWNFNEEWQYLRVKSDQLASPFDSDSETGFLLNRPYGYIKAGEMTTEYEISHVSWHTYKVEEYSINVDFSRQFDPYFSIMNSSPPRSVMLVEGSSVEIGTNLQVKS